MICFNPIAIRMAKTLSSFGRSECNRVKKYLKEIIRKVLMCDEEGK